MSNNRTKQKVTHDDTFTSLQEKPQRRRPLSKASLSIFFLGCIIIVGGVGILIWQLAIHAPSISSNSTATSSGPLKAQPTQAPGCGTRLPWDFLTQEAATKLHLSVAQIKSFVLTGKSIQDVATAQGISQDQLHTIEVETLQASYDKYVSMNCYTRQEADAGFRQDSTETPAQLNADFTRYFSHATP